MLMDLMNSRANEYHRKAEECRVQAGKAKGDEERASWLKLAAQWERLSEGAMPVSQQAQQPENKKQP
jgi:gluconate kinase